MFYLITYATHDERYFRFIKDRVHKVLGFGTEWKGFHDKVSAVVDFCKTVDADSIVCFVDGFDSVVLASDEEIESEYKKFGKDLVFSRNMSKPNHVISKYMHDKMFSKCHGKGLNSGLYIGKAQSIVKFWSSMEKGDDDQRFASVECSHTGEDVIVDDAQDLFYNYSSLDEDNITSTDKELFINGKKILILGAPWSSNVNHLLDKIGYKELPDDVKQNYMYRAKAYAKLFIPEIIFIIISIIIYTHVPDKRVSLGAIFALLLELVHYEVFVKHLKTSTLRKVVYTCVDFIHICIMMYLISQLFYSIGNTKKIIIINTLFFGLIGLFFVFKKCFLTIVENKVLGLDQSYNSVSRDTRLKYLVDPQQDYTITRGNSDTRWMDGNLILVIILICVNLSTLYRARL